MQWMILGCGLIMLLLLTRKPRLRSMPETSEPPKDLVRLAESIRREGVRGYGKVPLRSGLLPQLEKALRRISRFSGEELLPASRLLCENGRFLQLEAEKTVRSIRRLPKLPRSHVRTPRLLLFTEEIVRQNADVLAAGSLQSFLSVWQEQLPLTHDELQAFPVLLQAAFMEEILELAQQCERDQQAQSAATQTHFLLQNGKINAAQKIILRFGSSAVFREGLLRLEETDDWMENAALEWQESPEELAQREHERQAQNSRRAANAVLSLHSISRMPWQRLMEEASVMHAELMQDAVYQKMDAESRCYYRSCAASIARRCRRTERAVCSSAAALCHSAPSSSAASHIGYYLTDDGLVPLLEHLHAFTPFFRLRDFGRRHAHSLSILALCAVFILLLAVGFFSGYAILFLVPFSLVFTDTAKQVFSRVIQRIRPKRMIPRIELEQLSAEQQVLVVCTAVLKDAAHALSMVKHLSVMHEANPDPHLHFMLLGDFQESLTAALGTDAQIIASASAAVDALHTETNHPFFYLQRERIYSPGEQNYHCRENRHGALETLLCLIQDRSVYDSLAFASVDPASFHGRYRYVLLIDGDTHLPPDSALKLAGAMMHPLQKRRMENGRMRGISILYPRTETAAGTKETLFSHLLDRPFGENSEMGSFGIIDPEPYLDALQGHVPEGRFLDRGLLESMLAGQASAQDIVLTDAGIQTFAAYLKQLHRRTRNLWQMLPCLLPAIGYECRRYLDPASRLSIWQGLFRSLLPLFRLALMLYAGITDRSWLLAAALLLPELLQLSSFSMDAFSHLLAKIAVFPCSVFVQTDAFARTLYQLIINPRHLQNSLDEAKPAGQIGQPSMLYFTISMTFAGVFAAFPVLFGGAWFSLLPALVWAGFSFLLPALEQKRSAVQHPTAYMHETLLRLAGQTLTYFETAITPSDHALPPESVQIEPNKGILHRTTPTAIGMYLCSLIAASKMKLLPPDETAERMDETLTTLETLPKWHGLLYSLYDTNTLTPLSADVLSAECGLLAVCLLTCAQGIRSLLPVLDPRFHALPSRLDGLCEKMELEKLYDPEAHLFWNSISASDGKPSVGHCEHLADEGSLMSFVSVMLRRVPIRHWQQLDRAAAPEGALLSRHGGMLSYMLFPLFHPLAARTLLERSCRQALQMQRRHRLGGAFGTSACSCHTFDPSLRYQVRHFGLPELALEPDTPDDVLAPYASMLCLPLNLKAAFDNLQRLQRLGLEGPLGLFEAADFSQERAGEKAMAVVRCHRSDHQGMVLCAICNVLCEGFPASLFASLPRVQAYQHLLQEPVSSYRSLIRRPFRTRFREETAASSLFSRAASPLHFPVDAHLLCGGETALLIDAQGGGYLKHGGRMLTRFCDDTYQPSGIRLYLRDSESGAYWTATDPYLTSGVRFEAAQAVFCAERFGIQSKLRIWIDPLAGSCIHCLELENTQDSQRLMEISSYLEPNLSFFSDSETDQDPLFRTKRLNTYGAVVARCTGGFAKAGAKLWHILSTQTPLDLFRIQTDRDAFLRRGRDFLSPHSMSLPIGAMPDSLGVLNDPCISLRAQFTLNAKSKAMFCFITHVPEEQEDPDSFCERFAETDAIVRTYDSACTRSRVTAHYLRLTDGMQKDISRMTGTLLYSGQPMPSFHQKGFSAPPTELPGLSAHDPLLLYTCCGSINKPFLKMLLNAHAFWRINGFPVTLVILTENSVKSDEVAADAQAAAEESHSRDMLNRRGGVFLLSKLSAQEEQWLHSAARLCLSSGGGTLEQQLAERSADVSARPLYLPRHNAQWKPRLSEEETLYHNGYGGFVPQTGNYQITLVPGQMTPSPWCGLLYDPPVRTLTSESGLIETTDSLSTPFGAEELFLRDEENRLLWSLTRLPLGHSAAVRITHAPGETVCESSAFGIHAQMICASDAETHTALRAVHLKNDTSNECSLTLFHICRFFSGDGTGIRLECTDGDARCFVPPANGWAGLCAVSPPEASVSSLPAGVLRGLRGRAPFALSCLEKLPRSDGDTAVLSFRVRLKPGESCTLSTALVFSVAEQEFAASLARLRSEGTTSRLRAVRGLWEEKLGVMQFELPDQALNFLLGRWLPYQLQAGFWPPHEDRPLQDLPALLLTCPSEARASLLRCARQYRDHRRMLLPYVLAAYLRLTGDESILEESRKETAEPLVLCCLNNLESIAYGAHDLPLTESGTESVWQGMLLCEALRSFMPYCESHLQIRFSERRQLLLSAIERSAWDGGWYLSGWDANGEKLGSAACSHHRLDLLTQCWAVLCGASRERSELAMENVWRFLYDQHAGLLRASLEPASADKDVQDTQTACLAMAAFHQLGQDERAWELLGALMPVSHTLTRQAAACYRAEPYLMPETVYADAALRGRGERTWYSSPAACFLNAVIFHLLGLHIEGDQLRLRPVVPPGWDEFRITCRRGSATYHLHAMRSCLQPTADGEPLPDGVLLLADDGKIHEAFFPLRS